jgi:hypothetical protein
MERKYGEAVGIQGEDPFPTPFLSSFFPSYAVPFLLPLLQEQLSKLFFLFSLQVTATPRRVTLQPTAHTHTPPPLPHPRLLLHLRSGNVRPTYVTVSYLFVYSPTLFQLHKITYIQNFTERDNLEDLEGMIMRNSHFSQKSK